MAANPIKIIDATGKNATTNPKTQPDTVTKLYFITLVYHRQITSDEPDWAAFKSYLNQKLTEFLQSRLPETLRTYDPELAKLSRPTFTFDISLEHNRKNLLHHHLILGITSPRIMGPEGRVSKWIIDYKDFNRIFREAMGLAPHGISIKIQIESINGVSNIDNLKRYILKNV